MVRRERTQLIETIERSRMLYAPLGAKYHEQDKMWRFPNGARLRFAYLESDSDADAYQGHSYTRVYVEEVGTFPRPEPVLKLMATLRSGAGVPCGFRATGNPGGPGHNWVRARYIDPAPLGWEVGARSFTNPFTGAAVSRDWVYIPSRLTDNHYLGDQYVANLYMSGSPALVRAWLEGDWSAIEGAFFDCWSPAKHVVRPFAIPDDWLRFRSMDWGSAAPFSVGWWAVVGDDTGALPRGALVRYREWYGTGAKLTAEEVAQGIIDREARDHHLIKYGVLDPSAFAQDGGPSIAERMHRHARTMGSSLLFRPADNKRVTQRGAMGGWDQVRARLKGGADGRPMLVTFSTCPDFIRTIPVLQHDSDKPEDLATEGEDHAADECFVAGTLVRTSAGTKPIEAFRVGDPVESADGCVSTVTAVFSVGIRPVFDLVLSDGTVITGTAEHPVFVEGQGFVALASLGYADMVRPWTEKPSYSTAKPITAGSAIRAGIGGSIIGRIAGRFTALSGKRRTGQFLRATLSTTSTATRSTTIWRTWLSWLTASTLGTIGQRGSRSRGSASIAEGRLPLAHGRSSASAPMLASRQIDGLAGPMTKSEPAKLAPALSQPIGTQSSDTALRDAHPMDSTSDRHSNSSATDAGTMRSRHRRYQGSAPLHVVSVTPAGSARVFNLTVEAGVYFANGILVHNCRYACMSRPWIAEPAAMKEPRPMMVGSGNRATLNDAWNMSDNERTRSHRI